MHNLTCLIPLYRSWRFRKIITTNIDQHIKNGASIIISDRHLFDKTIEYLEKHYQNESTITFIRLNDKADWVDNINTMISTVKTDYFRIIPHDDTASFESSQLLINALENNSKAILASGIVHAKNLFNFRIRKHDELNIDEENRSWGLAHEEALSVYWQSRFAGAFKGVIRSKTIIDNDTFIKKTHTLVHSERTWLFALALLGEFCFVPKSTLIKRYHANSTQKSWQYTDQTTIQAAQIMCQYCDQLLTDSKMIEQLKFSLYLNALEKIRPFKSVYHFLSSDNIN